VTTIAEDKPRVTFGTHIVFASVLYLGGATLFGYKPDWMG